MWDDYRRRRDRAAVAALLLSAVAMSGCSAGGGFGSPTGTAPATGGSPSFTDQISNFFSGSTANSRQGVAGAMPDVNCPFIDIRQGAGTLSVGPPGDSSAMALQYQGTFVRAARECAVAGTDLSVKLGVQGRIIVGPAGGPGSLVVPLRVAVVHETTAGSKTITTKLVRIPVTVEAGRPFTEFTHIEEALRFPLPPPAQLDDYKIYIGFDPLAADAQEKNKPKRSPRARPAG
jgi:hypothetical protein